MTWEEAVRWLYSLERRGVKLDLDRVRACLEDLGRPQDAFPSILVAGTNGKGSTAATLASILAAAGLRVGLYTSPHLLDLRERIRLDGRLAGPAALLEVLERDRDIWERHELSFFEAMTALAFALFREERVELAVLEVGLGGRLDATNTVEPILSVITELGMDHQHLLGDTPAAIAREKAGILRAGVPAVVAGGAPEAARAVRERAFELGAPYYRRSLCVTCRALGRDPGGTAFLLQRRPGSSAELSLPEAGLRIASGLPGSHQVANTALAVLAALVLRQRGFDVPDEALVGGPGRLRWPGRLERPMPGLPLLADVAHNREGARVLARHLAATVPGRRIRPVVGMVAHKDHAGFFAELARVARAVRIAPLQTERSASAEDLRSAAAAAGLEAISFATIEAALDDALAAAPGPELPLVLLCGSFHTLEEGYRHLGIGPKERLWDGEPVRVREVFKV